MPDYRLVYLLVYRLPAHSDAHASGLVVDALTATFPKAKFEVVDARQSAVQNQAGKILYDVQVAASGEVTATSIANALTKVSVPASLVVATGTATRTTAIEMAAIDTRVEGKF